MKKHLGFTLVEMAVVLVVIGLVLAGLLGTVQMQLGNAKIRETKQSLVDIREALISFAMTHGYLPCPANPTLANTAAGAGQEDRLASGLCNRLNGVIPWATLGVKELDSWGGRYSYSVSDDYLVDPYTPSLPQPPSLWTAAQTNLARARASRFARRLPTPSDVCSTTQTITSTFGLCSLPESTNGRINIRSSTGGTIIAANVVAVIVSHGKNRRGSFNPGGGARIAGSLGNELENANANTNPNGALDTNFVSSPFEHDPNQLAATYYDDLTEWIAAPLLLGRMVNAGKLP